MKKIDYLNIFICALFVILLYLIFSNNQIYGSVVDWESQHHYIPEYFRLLFYKTKDLFPDFAFNLGAGQNIYYFTYYGFLNPVILISYLFPFISMMNYLILSGFVLTILSVYLIYLFLKRNGFSTRTTFISTVIYLTAAPIIFHTHRHIMFVNYMPFVILSLIEIDKYFETGRRSNLLISVFLIIMTSYFFSFSSLIMLVIYGIYKYTKKYKVNIKTFLKEGFKFLFPFIGAVLLSSVLLLPVVYTLFNGRVVTESPNILEYFKPDFSFSYLLYGSYTMGLTAISVIAIINALRKKSKYRFLGIILFIIMCFPIFNFLLNGTLYLNGKVYIPFIPLVILLVSELLESKNINFKFILISLGILTFINYLSDELNELPFYFDLYFMILILFLSLKRKNILYILIPFMFIYSFNINNSERFVTILNEEKTLTKNINYLIDKIRLLDNDLYRIGVNIKTLDNTNRIYNNDYYSLNVYSSTYNQTYNNMYFDVFNNNIDYRNRAITGFTSNKIFNDYMSVKYVITDKKINYGYKLVMEKDGVYLYESDDDYPLGYVTYSYTNKNEYEESFYPYRVYSLINSAVLENKETTIENKIKNITPDIKILESDFEFIKEDDSYKLDLSNISKMKVSTNIDDNQILFIRFKMLYSEACSKNDTYIKINDVLNKLTCSSWKYHNKNYIFDYVLYENVDILDIVIEKGKYEIKDIEFYTLEKEDIYTNKNITPLNIEEYNTKNYILKGNIEIKEHGYFILNIPYDKGFKINVDGNYVNYENVNEGLIGFELKEGKHQITVEFLSPYKQIGIICSIMGMVILFYLKIKDVKLWKKSQ